MRLLDFGWIPEAAPERGVSPPLRRRLLREAVAPLSGAGFGRGGPPPNGRSVDVERTQKGPKRTYVGHFRPLDVGHFVLAGPVLF